MASLTDQLPSVDSGRRIIQPADSGPSVVGGFGKLFGDALDTWGDQSRRSETAKKAAMEDKVLSQVEVGVFNLRKEASERIRAGAADDMDLSGTMQDIGVPKEVADEAAALDRQRRATEQGRATQAAYQLKLESFVSDMYARYPDYANAIGKYMAERKFDHPVFREAKLSEALQAGADSAAVEGRNETIKKAVAMGVDPAGGWFTDEAAYQAGVALNRADREIEMAQKLGAEHRAQAAEGRAAFNHTQSQIDRHVTNAIGAEMEAKLGPLTFTFGKLSTAIGDSNDSAALTQLQDLSDNIDVVMEQARSAALQRAQAANASPDAITRINSTFDQKKKELQDYISGPLSRFQQRNRAYENMKTEFGLTDEKALPYFSWAKRNFGMAGVEAIFGDDLSKALSPEIQEKVRGELMDFDPLKPNPGLDTLAEIGALVQGNVNLQDIPEANITGDYLRAANATLSRTIQNIYDPEPEQPGEFESMMGSLGTIAVASTRIQPGYKDIKALDWAAGAITNDRVANTLDLLMKNPQYKGKATVLMHGTRQAAAQLLEVTRTAGPKVQGQRVVWKNGSFQVEVDQRRSTKGMAVIPSDSGISVDPDRFDKIGVNPELQKQALIMNKTVHYLAETAKHDPDLKAFNYPQLVAHYAVGTPLPVKKDADGKPTVDLKKQVDNFEQELERFSKDIAKNEPYVNPKSPISFKSPMDAIVRTVIGEAGAEDDVGKKAVAAVILNRARQSGMKPEEVVTAKNQFEPWSSRAEELMSIPEDDPKYQQVKRLVEQVMAGDDPTGGADHFYAPKLQRDLRRKPPGFENGKGVDIGNHRFFKHGYSG